MEFRPIIANHNILCPCCGSDMKRTGNDNPHNKYVHKYSCQNQQCAIETIVRE